MSSQQSLTMRGFFEASVSASARDIGQSSLGVGARVSRPISTPDRKKGAGGLDAAHQSFQNVSEASFSSVAGWGATEREHEDAGRRGRGSPNALREAGHRVQTPFRARPRVTRG